MTKELIKTDRKLKENEENEKEYEFYCKSSLKNLEEWFKKMLKLSLWNSKKLKKKMKWKVALKKKEND